MSKTSVDVKWIENMSFETEMNGHKIILDAPVEAGGQDKGPRPKPFMLTALAGCTGIDASGFGAKPVAEFFAALRRRLVFRAYGPLENTFPLPQWLATAVTRKSAIVSPKHTP